MAYGVSERRACEVMAAVRSTVRYVSVRPKQEALRRRLRELAAHWFLSLDDARDKIESWRED